MMLELINAAFEKFLKRWEVRHTYGRADLQASFIDGFIAGREAAKTEIRAKVFTSHM